MARRLASFIDSFVTFASTYNSTPLFAKWAALWQVGTVVTRAVGMKARGNDLHPNLFVQLIGGPGAGKGQTMKAVRRIFIRAFKCSLIPASVTRAGMEDYMQTNLKQRKGPDGSMTFSHECIGLSEEMQGILPDQDLGHLTLYNILYDLPPVHKAVTRTNGEVTLETPYCSILTGAQPAFLAMSMNEQAWGMGFMSRSIMAFDVPRTRTSIFDSPTPDPKLEADLIHDLSQIGQLTGWMTWTKEARALYEEWFVVEGGKPIPQAKRLAMGYNARRELHMIKMALIFSLSRSDDLVVELEDVAMAIDLLINTESRMTNIFAEMSNTGTMVAIEDTLDIVRVRTAAGETCPESTLIELLMQRVPATQVHAVIENLLSSHAIKQVHPAGAINAKGFRHFVVGSRAATS